MGDRGAVEGGGSDGTGHTAPLPLVPNNGVMPLRHPTSPAIVALVAITNHLKWCGL